MFHLGGIETRQIPSMHTRIPCLIQWQSSGVFIREQVLEIHRVMTYDHDPPNPGTEVNGCAILHDQSLARQSLRRRDRESIVSRVSK